MSTVSPRPTMLLLLRPDAARPPTPLLCGERDASRRGEEVGDARDGALPVRVVASVLSDPRRFLSQTQRQCFAGLQRRGRAADLCEILGVTTSTKSLQMK
eukprot:1401085-Rhodomonas_salina.4